jgi:Outer membrane protein (OmpH-like)
MKDDVTSKTLEKKFEPKQNELKSLADEIDSFKKQLRTQQDELNDESRGKLVKLIELKQKSFECATQDAQEDFQNQRGEAVSKILTKMAPVIQKYFTDCGYALLLDTSQPWPQGPVVLAGLCRAYRHRPLAARLRNHRNRQPPSLLRRRNSSSTARASLHWY